MVEYSARALLELSEDELWSLPMGERCVLSFDDEVVDDVPVCEVVLSWYFWQLTRYYDELPITSDLFLNGRMLNDKSMQDMLNCAIQASRAFPHIDKEDIWALAYRECYNKLFNALVTRGLPFISSTDAEHVLEILNDPDVKEANRKVTPALATIERAHEVLERKFYSDEYPNNPIMNDVKSGGVKMNQMKPSFGPRALCTDIDSEIYRRPSTRGFAMGFTSLTEFAMESRSGAKAALFNKNPVAIAEYFNRKLQLVTSVIRRVIPGDCGTHEYHALVISNRDLFDSMVGLYRLDDNNRWVVIRKTDKFLMNKEVRFRTTVTCRHLQQQAVCECCYGDVAYALPYDTNPGHVSCTAVNKLITQIIISTKHLDFIVHSFLLRLSQKEEAYVVTKENKPDMLFLAPHRKGESLVIRFAKEDAPKLVDVNYVSMIENMNIPRTTALHYLEFYIEDQNGVLQGGFGMDMVRKSTRASLTPALLGYIKKYGWKEDDKHYLVNLKHWEIKNPLFTYPHRHENMAEFGDRVERFFRSSNAAGEDSVKKKTRQMLTTYSDATEALFDAHYMISEKLKGVYLGHIATILAGSRVVDGEQMNYHLPVGLHGGHFETHDRIIKHRDMTTTALFEGQGNMFDELDSYLHKDRVPGILQPLIYIPVDNKPK